VLDEVDQKELKGRDSGWVAAFHVVDCPAKPYRVSRPQTQPPMALNARASEAWLIHQLRAIMLASSQMNAFLRRHPQGLPERAPHRPARRLHARVGGALNAVRIRVPAHNDGSNSTDR
jgi:hypothetical protein